MNKDTKEVETKKEAPGKIVEIHEGEIKAHVDQVVRESVEEGSVKNLSHILEK
jgi:hypothetical protein